MATATLYHDTRSSNKKGQHPIKILVYHAGEQRLYSIKEFATIEEYRNLPLSKKHLDKYRWQGITDMKNKADLVIKQLGGAFSFEKFRRLFRSKTATITKGSLLPLKELYEKRIAELEGNSQFKTAKYYNTSLAALSKFGGTLNLQDITEDFLHRFEKWVLGNGNSTSTVGTYLRPCRTIYNRAIADGFINQDSSPFGKGKFSICCATSANSALTQEQLRAFWGYEPKNEAQRRAKSYWFFSLFCNGIAPVDIANLKWSDLQGEYIVFQRQKTRKSTKKATPIVAKVTDPMKVIIKELSDKYSHYIFPILSKYMTEKEKYEKVEAWKRLTNRVLFRMSKYIDKDLTLNLYAARHSYANKLMVNGVPVAHISLGLGHANIRTTENYLGSLPSTTYNQYAAMLTDFISEPKNRTKIGNKRKRGRGKVKSL